MNDKPVFDPDRDRAIRAMIVENARAEKARPSLRTRASLLIGLVVAALLVSGGGVAMALTGIIQIPVSAPAPAPAPVETPTATPTPTQTTAPAPPPAPEPTTTPTPTPTPTAVDPSTWVISFDGVGPIAFGGPIADASAALDTTDLVPFSFSFEECPSDYRQLPDSGRTFVGVDPDDAGAVDRIVVANYLTDEGSQLDGALPRTVSGISTGSTRAQLVATYPGLVEEPPVSGDAVYSLAGPDERRLWFLVATATDTVQAISLTTTPVYTLGGCGA
ncbi:MULTISPECIES: hypothetical protein [unclassified Rathayibacter]|uniref:hypothetical protein n=1 Tax=unclassified Rathayibacter TaxID=2609250 RepID=UPI0006F87231|nr:MULTISPECIES: hypothetical protein [unclassified Rathayibacter]KQQ05273.1 hypothetical protein ASF42_01270 [Rathayibacter sp. Leaf294]KQS13135.1 hypothetical protein ASG06_01270 [Rathayibacter sp. Leaf185]